MVENKNLGPEHNHVTETLIQKAMETIQELPYCDGKKTLRLSRLKLSALNDLILSAQ